MNNIALEKGDVVRIKSGGPAMVIKTIEQPHWMGWDHAVAYCAWFDPNGEHQVQLFPLDILERTEASWTPAPSITVRKESR